MDRRGDRAGGGDRGGSGDRGGGGDMGRRTNSRWSSGSPTNDHFPRGDGGGGGRFPRGGDGGGRGFSGGGVGRFHPYRAPQDYPTGDGDGPGFRGGPAGFGHQGPMGGGPKRGFFGRGGSPDYVDGSKLVKLFIGSVPRTATEEDIRPLFEEHGNVIEVALIRDKRSGQQQGFCFVKYATTEEADRAIAALHHQHTLPGAFAPLQVRYADVDRERNGPAEDKLFVASLNKRATEQEIAEIFAPYGHVVDVYLMKDDFKQSRGCGFVRFASRDMAAAAMHALHGTYVMMGCDQPLIVRFADPKRPRPDPRGAPAYGGPGFGHRSEASTVVRPTSNFDVPMAGRLPPNTWGPGSPQPNGPSSLARPHGFGSNSSAKGGAMETSSPAGGSLGDTGGPASGSQSSLVAAPLSQQGFNPSMAQTNPVVGQQMPPLQKPLIPPQHLQPSLQPPNNQHLASYSQGQALPAPMQLGQIHTPHSFGLPSNQTVPSQQLPGMGGQLSVSQPSNQQSASAAGMQTQLGLQQQGMGAVSNQQQLPASAMSHQLLQRPVQQIPSQFPQVLLQQQAQALQSSFQSSQQALFQLQQQVQLMQQSSQQQQLSLNSKQQAPTWNGSQTTSGTPVSAPPVLMPSAVSSAISVPVTTPSVAPLTCSWTEHTSPEGFKYYYNSVTSESKWEKPEEYLIFEQQQQQQKLLLLQQQQQKLAVQQLQTPAQTANLPVQPAQQASQTQQVQSQMQLMQQQAQLQLLQPSLSYQAPGAAGHQSIQDFNYAHLQAAGSVNDPARRQQGQVVQAAPESWQNKPAGS